MARVTEFPEPCAWFMYNLGACQGAGQRLAARDWPRRSILRLERSSRAGRDWQAATRPTSADEAGLLKVGPQPLDPATVYTKIGAAHARSGADDDLSLLGLKEQLEIVDEAEDEALRLGV